MPSTSPKIKLGIADDHNLFRKGIVSILKEMPDVEVVVEANNGQELLEMISRGPKPHVVLLDIKMPQLDGLRTTKHLRAAYSNVRIIMLTMHDEEKFMTHLIEMGVSGYLLKNCEPEEMERAIRTVAQGGQYFTSEALSALYKRLQSRMLPEKKRVRSVDSAQNFSERELQVLRLICKEYTTGEIAEELCLSARTIEGYRQRLIRKTRAKNSAGIVAYAIENYLFDRNAT